MEVDCWPLFNQLRVHTDPVEFLTVENNSGESLWVYLAKLDKNHSYDFNFKKVVASIGLRLTISDEKKFFSIFGIGLNIEIWQRNSKDCFKIKTIYRTKYTKAGYKIHRILIFPFHLWNLNQRVRKGKKSGSLEMIHRVVLYQLKEFCLKQFFESDEVAKSSWHYQKGDFTKSYICSNDIFQISTKQIFWCENENCQRRFESKSLLDNHKESCPLQAPIQTITYKQSIMAYSSEEENFLASIGFKFNSTKFCTFDIECSTKTDVGQKKLHQTIISISCCASWKTTSPKCFLRKNSCTSSAQILVKEFLVELHSLQLEYVTKFCSEIVAVENHINDLSMNMNFASKHVISKAQQYLANLKKLICIGWNSERYDMPQLFAFLIAYFGNSGEEIFIIRRGSGKYQILIRLC